MLLGNACGCEATSQEVGTDPGDAIGVDDVGGIRFDHHIFLVSASETLLRSDEVRADISQARPHQTGGGDLLAPRNGVCQRQRPRKEAAYFFDQSKRT